MRHFRCNVDLKSHNISYRVRHALYIIIIKLIDTLFFVQLLNRRRWNHRKWKKHVEGNRFLCVSLNIRNLSRTIIFSGTYSTTASIWATWNCYNFVANYYRRNIFWRDVERPQLSVDGAKGHKQICAILKP